MNKFPTSEEILATTAHRPSAEIRLLSGIYDLLLEIADLKAAVPRSPASADSSKRTKPL